LGRHDLWLVTVCMGNASAECTTAEAAELIVATAGTELQALIADQNLAGEMSGVALAHYARQRYPDMNIIIMSGTAVPLIPDKAIFLQKPFAPAKLLAAVRD